MRVYVPDRKDSAIAEAIKDLYLLSQTLKHSPSNTESCLKIIEKIRTSLQDCMQDQES